MLSEDTQIHLNGSGTSLQLNDRFIVETVFPKCGTARLMFVKEEVDCSNFRFCPPVGGLSKSTGW
jgi:hypothetical protein